MVNILSPSEKFHRRTRKSKGTLKNACRENFKIFSPHNKRNYGCHVIECISLILIILLSSSQVNAQSNFRKYLVSGSLLFASGCSDGVAETMKFHYEEFQKVFPKADTSFWDPSISWKNKYKNNDPEEGPKFFGSTTFLVGVTDSYHMSRTFRNSFVFGSIAFKIGEPKQKWYYYAGEFIAGGLIYRAGFWTTYEVIFRK